MAIGIFFSSRVRPHIGGGVPVSSQEQHYSFSDRIEQRSFGSERGRTDGDPDSRILGCSNRLRIWPSVRQCVQDHAEREGQKSCPCTKSGVRNHVGAFTVRAKIGGFSVLL